MAPIKFEENIREKLQEREIRPGADAWKKLDGRLDEIPPVRSRSYRWLAIAAGLITILLIGGFLMNRTSTEVNPSFTEQEVDSSIQPATNTEIAVQDDTIEEEETIPANEESLEQPEVNEVIYVDEQLAKINKSLDESPMKGDLEPVIETTTDAVVVNETDKKLETPANTNLNDPSENDAFIDGKVDEVVAEVYSLQQQNSEVTPEEIDALLAKAQREISNQKILDGSGTNIDAASLLQDVELEIERSFRDKVFDVLGEGFQKVRTAVAERNN